MAEMPAERPVVPASPLASPVLDLVDRRQVRRAYRRAAAGFDAAAAVPREIAARMAERLDYCKLQPQRVLDLGCGTGSDLSPLRQRYPQAAVVGADLAPAMLAVAQDKARRAAPWLQRLLPFLHASPDLVAGDAAALPFASGSFGLVWSNLVLHWLGQPGAALAEAHRVLADGGLFMFAVPGPDTLQELRAAFAQAIPDGASHSQRFIDMHDWGDLLVANGFADPVLDMEMLTLTYPDFDALVSELRALGATCAMPDRRRQLLGREAAGRLRAAYEAQARHHEGRLPVTLEVVYGHAWKVARPEKRSSETAERSVIRFMERPR